MKKKVFITTKSDISFKAFAELFSCEADFDDINRYEYDKDYNYNTIDLIIADNDKDIIEKIRAKGYRKALFALFDEKDDNLNFETLEKGATDVMVKPISFEALLTRARAAIYAEENTFDGMITINSFVFMPKARLLRYVDKEIHLTEKEVGIITILHKAKPAAVDRLTILKEIWGYAPDISTHTLETHIYHLRQKIEAVTIEKFIVTLDDGYALAS